MELISRRIADKLEGLLGACFDGNRLMDRTKSLLAVKFVMPITSNWLHYNVAHRYPELADEIGDYMEERNHPEKYPETSSGTFDFETTREVFEHMLNFFIEFEQLIVESIKVALEENDLMTKKFLDNFLLEQKAFTNVGLTLCDLSEQYGCTPKDNMQLDAHVHGKLKGIKP